MDFLGSDERIPGPYHLNLFYSSIILSPLFLLAYTSSLHINYDASLFIQEWISMFICIQAKGLTGSNLFVLPNGTVVSKTGENTRLNLPLKKLN